MTERTFDTLYRNYVTDDLPSSGNHKPLKSDIRDTLKARVGGSISGREVVKTDDYTILTTENGWTFVADKATAITFTLPSAALAAAEVSGESFQIRIHNVGVGTLTVDVGSFEPINGTSALTFESYDSAVIWTDGTEWRCAEQFTGSTIGLDIFKAATAGAALTVLGVSAFMQTVLDDVDAPTARATLVAAASGANSDITSLLALTDVVVTGGFSTTVGTPVGNPGYNAKTSGFFDVDTTTDASPEFGLLVNMVSTHGNSTAGSGAHKAALFSGMEVGAGSSDGWAGVFVTQLVSGAPAARGAIGVEIDLNNNKENIDSTTGRYTCNLYVTGGGSYQSTAAIWVNSTTNLWYRGLYFGGAGAGGVTGTTIQDDTNSTTSMLVQGSHTNGIDLSNGSFSSSAFKSTGFNVTGTGAVTTAGTTATSASDTLTASVCTGTNNSARMQLIGRQTSADSEYNLVSAGNGLGAAGLRFVKGTWTGTPIMTLDVGVVVGGATGGDKGAGTINTAADIYKNNSAYTNPDYVFEHHYTGVIAKFVARDGAKDYAGILPLKDLRAYTRDHLRLPGMSDDPLGVFARADKALEKIEEAHLYIMELEERLAQLEAV